MRQEQLLSTSSKYDARGDWDRVGHQLCAGNNELWDKSGRPCYYANCRWRETGDILEMILDLNEKTLRYILNGKDCGIAFNDIDDGSYRLAVTCWGGTGAEFEFL